MGSSVNGPHQLPHSQQQRVAVEGRRLDNHDKCTIILIRDPHDHTWVLYPHGVDKYGVRIGHEDACTLAYRILGGRAAA